MPPSLQDIRLIVTDMDGTLLDGNHQLPKGFVTAVTTLQARGIHWAIASGRQLANLKDLFTSVGVDLDLIAENGAIAQRQGDEHPFFLDLTPIAFFHDILQAALTIPGATPVLCGPFHAWIHDAYPADHPVIRRYFSNADLWHNLSDVAHVEVCKLAIYHPSAATALWPTLGPFHSETCKVILSSDHWIDIQPQRIHKGNGLQALLNARGLLPQEAIVFGDYLNDVEMMTLGTHAVAMANAHPDLKALCPYTTSTNTDDGVLRYLRQHGLL